MLNKIQSKIVELVETNWQTHHLPLFMATVGGQLRREFSAEELDVEFLGGKLRKYIERNLSGWVRMIETPPGSAVWALVPASAEVQQATASSSEGDTTAIGDAKPARPYVRYDRALWLAFTTPNLTSTDRYILLGDRIGTAEISKGGTAPPGAIKVEAQDLEHPDAGYSAIADKIEGWASRNQIDLSSYKRASSGLPKKSLLELIVETLPESDLHQIAMPLSAIKTLSEKKI